MDRYLEIDAAKNEISIETGLTVYNVVNVRSQPGAAGTILNNLCALGIKEILPIGFYGDDAEGLELERALSERPGVNLRHFLKTSERRTFTYTKPMLMTGGSSQELNRLDFKNWTPTPDNISFQLGQSIDQAAKLVDGFIFLDQVDLPETGVITSAILKTIGQVRQRFPDLIMLADSRRGLKDYPPVDFKMNASEFKTLTGQDANDPNADVKIIAGNFAKKLGNRVFVTLAERGILAVNAKDESAYLPSLPLRGPIDIVGAGDAVTANLTAALSAEANLEEAVELANAAASIVIHKLGTTGTTTVEELEQLLFGAMR